MLLRRCLLSSFQSFLSSGPTLADFLSFLFRITSPYCPDIPLKITCLAPLYRQLGVVPVAGQIDGALKHLDEQEKLALQRLGKIMQWQHATLPAARLLGHKPIVRASSPVVDSLLVLLQRSTSGAPPSDDGRVHALNVRAQQLAIGTPSWLHCYWPWFIVGAVGLWSTSRIWRALNLTQIVGDYLGNLNITVQRFAKERLWDVSAFFLLLILSLHPAPMNECSLSSLH